MQGRQRHGYAPCTSPVNYTERAANGPHVFTVRATDLAGNVEVDPPSHDWTVSLPLPDTMITHAPDPDSASSTADFSFVSVPGGATFQCRLDSTADADFATCTTPLEYTNLADGQHTFDVRAVNASGTDPTPAHFAWLIDTTGPRAAISSAPQAIECPAVSFAYTTEPAEADASFICALVVGPGPAGAADYAPCSTSGASYTGLLDATQYTFSVIAVDPLGNKGPAASQTFTVDGNGPAITITSPTAGTSGPSIAVKFTAVAGDTYTCTVAGSSTEVIHDCVSGQTFTGLAAGPQTVTVSGTDQCNNLGTASVAIQVVVPTTVTVDSPAAASSTCTTGSITYSIGTANTVMCTLDSTSVPCDASGIYTYSDLSGGEHVFTVTGLDQFGQVVGTSSVQFNVDNVGPTIDIDPPQDPKAAHGALDHSCVNDSLTFTCVASGANDCPPADTEAIRN